MPGYYRNTDTGVTWYVSDPATEERLRSQPHYEEVSPPDGETSLSSLPVKELRRLAAERGIQNYSAMKKSELVRALEG